MTSEIVLGIHLRFHRHTPEQAAVCLAFHQPAANQLRANGLRWTAEESTQQGWKVLGDGQGGYGTGLKNCLTLSQPSGPGVTKPRQQSSGFSNTPKRQPSRKKPPQSRLPSSWRFTNLQPISSGPTTSAGRRKKAWAKAGKS